MFHERTTNLLFLRDTPLSGETGTLVYLNCGFFPSFYGDAHPLVEKRKNKTRQEEPNIVMERGGGGGGCT